jgi:hypothetical protein
MDHQPRQPNLERLHSTLVKDATQFMEKFQQDMFSVMSNYMNSGRQPILSSKLAEMMFSGLSHKDVSEDLRPDRMGLVLIILKNVIDELDLTARGK